MNCHWCDISLNAHPEFDPMQPYCCACRDQGVHPRFCLAELSHGKILKVILGTDKMAEAVTRSVSMMEQGLYSEMLVWNKEHDSYRFTRSGDFNATA